MEYSEYSIMHNVTVVNGNYKAVIQYFAKLLCKSNVTMFCVFLNICILMDIWFINQQRSPAGAPPCINQLVPIKARWTLPRPQFPGWLALKIWPRDEPGRRAKPDASDGIKKHGEEKTQPYGSKHCLRRCWTPKSYQKYFLRKHLDP